MNKIAKIFSYIAFVCAFCCMAIGYAAVQDELIVNGIVSVNGYKYVEIGCTDTLAYTYDATTKTVTINDTYYDPNTRENYKVTGIIENGFSSEKIGEERDKDSSFILDATTIEAFKLSENISTIGANAFTGLRNLKTFTVVDENSAFTVQDDILFGIEDDTLTTLVRYPSMKAGSYYIVPATVLSITDGAFSDNESCEAIVTTQYSPSAWGSPVPNAFMLNPYGTGYDVESVAENETGYTVTFATTPTESTFLFQGKLYPGVEPDPTSLQTAEVDVNTVNLRRALCIEDTNGNHAQLYLSCYRTYAYGYMDGTTLNIYNGESVVIYGGVYDGTNLFYNSGIYNLPSGEGSVSGAEIVPGFPSWSTVAETIQKVVIAKDIIPDKIDGWFSGMSNCKELDLKKLDTTNIEADGKMEGMFLDCSGLDKLSLGANFGADDQNLGAYNTGLSDVITGWKSGKKVSAHNGFETLHENNMVYTDKIPLGKENTYTAITYCYATTDGTVSAALYIYQRKYVPKINEYFDNYTVKAIYRWENTDSYPSGSNPCKSVADSSKAYYNTAGYNTWQNNQDFCRSVLRVTIVDPIAPTNLKNWFNIFNKCDTFKGLENLNTRNAISMERMFCDVHELKDADLEKLSIDTTSATNFSEMFYNCYRITGNTLHFVTQGSRITNCAGMFKDCDSLQRVNLSNFVFDENGVTIAWLFRECHSLTEVIWPQGTIAAFVDATSSYENDYAGIDTLFFGCARLTEVDLSFIQVTDAVSARAAFANCTNLQRIYVSNGFTVGATYYTRTSLFGNNTDHAKDCDIFTGCTSLVGGSGTPFSDTHIDGTYARIDGGVGGEGYFTEKSET